MKFTDTLGREITLSKGDLLTFFLGDGQVMVTREGVNFPKVIVPMFESRKDALEFAKILAKPGNFLIVERPPFKSLDLVIVTLD